MSFSLLDKTGKFVRSSDSVQQYTELVLKNMGEILKASGVSYSSVVKTTIMFAGSTRFVQRKGYIDIERRQEDRLKELPPMKSGLVEKSVVKSEEDCLSEKINWLSSAQLRMDNSSSSNTSSQDKTSQEIMMHEQLSRQIHVVFEPMAIC